MVGVCRLCDLCCGGCCGVGGCLGIWCVCVPLPAVILVCYGMFLWVFAVVLRVW